MAELSAVQLLAVVKNARKRSQARSILIQADPSSLPEIAELDPSIVLRGSHSPLEVRSMVANDGSENLVIVTDCDRDDLGDDLLDRVAGNKVWSLNRWDVVKELFGARAIKRDLARSPHLADALIEAVPVQGYPKVVSGILDRNTALASLLQSQLDLPAGTTTLEDFLRWGMRGDSPSRLLKARSSIAGDLDSLLHERYGPGVAAVVAILGVGLGNDLIPWGLVAGVVHHPSQEATEETRVLLQAKVSKLDPAAWRAFAAAAEQVLTAHEPPTRSGWMARAEGLLGELSGSKNTHLSDVLPSGFEQRLQIAAAALASWKKQPSDPELENSAEIAISSAARHQTSNLGRVERLRMASRLIRRGSGPLDWGKRLSEAGKSYRVEGAWLDRARIVVSRGEADPTLDDLYRDLTSEFNQSRLDDNKSFAALARLAASPLPEDTLGSEQVLEQVVAQIATERLVLFIVLDGMGWPSFLEVLGAVTAMGWTWWTDQAETFTRPVFSVLPSVTEFSRASLFAGHVRQGTGESEKRAFAEHPALVAVSSKSGPPVLYHKKEFRVGGLDSVPSHPNADIADPNQRIVAVVLNNIDERLKDVTQPPEGWGLQELDPLSWLLREAHEAGRVVIFTSDHGHILDRNAVQVTAPGGGERWRPADTPPSEGEIEVSGPRVIGPSGQPNDRVVLPWFEQLRYSTRRNGYHGGITPQEVLIPLAVLTKDELPGWKPVSLPQPSWWNYQSPVLVLAPDRASAVGPIDWTVPERPTLFDVDAIDTEPLEWIDRVVAALSSHRTPLIRLTDDEIRALLGALAALGGMAISTVRLAEIAGLPPARITGYIGQLQQLVNIDGYGVVTVVHGEVRFDQPTLNRQLGLG